MTMALYITFGIAAINLAAILFGWRLAQYRRSFRRATPAAVRSMPSRGVSAAK